MHGEIVTSQILVLFSWDNQTSPMHTHLDHSSLCLISSLLSHSSSHSRCLYAVLLSTSSIEFCRMHGWWSLLLPTCFPGERLVTWRHVIKSPLPKTSMDSLKFPIKSYLESQTNAFRLSPKVVEPWLLYEGTDLEAAIRHHVNHSADDHDNRLRARVAGSVEGST